MERYRYDIKTNRNFGTELEFARANLDKLKKAFANTTLPVKDIYSHKNLDNLKYDIWYLDEDSTVTDKTTKTGGELSSRILTNTKSDWCELKEICELLINNMATIDENCSTHINIDIRDLINNAKFWEIFLKIIALMEEEIKLFYMGDKYFIRKTKAEYARNIGFYLIQYINKINFKDPDFNYKMRQSHLFARTLFTKKDGIHLAKDRMEIRYPNGSLNPYTIQNYINFSLKLVDSILKNKWDLEELNFKINHELEEMNFLLPESGNYKLFERLVEKISVDKEDEECFTKQFEKVLSTKNR